jgi:hypothetical protein
MLQVLKSNEGMPESFNNYNDLFEYIVESENLKLFEDHPQFTQTEWSFVVFSPKDVSTLYHNMNKSCISQTLKEAYESELSLIEICTGDYENPNQILFTPDVDIDELQKTWSLEYCKVHKTGWAVKG